MIFFFWGGDAMPHGDLYGYLDWYITRGTAFKDGGLEQYHFCTSHGRRQ